ncbi:MAG: hypothetical protein ACK5DD_06590 [Cyclobacteriaceae bacterium]
MKKIIIRRDQEQINLSVDYKVVFDDGPTISIGNGETKKIFLENIPVTAYAKLNWLRSKQVTIDATTTELVLKGEKTKSRLASGIGALLLLTLLPRLIWGHSPLSNTLAIIALSVILAWTIYAFIIKSNDWVLIELKKEN